MKLAAIGSYGHVGYVLGSAAVGREVKLAAVARYGPDDGLAPFDRHTAQPDGVPIYNDYRRMLDEVAPDVVSVCMPLYRNAEASMAAAERGCHVFSEKPLATTLEDLAALRRKVQENNVRIAAMFAMRAQGEYQAVRSVVAAGRIGPPVLAVGQKSYPFGKRDDYYRNGDTYGGTIPWVAIHALEFISYCTGKQYARVVAMQSNETLADYPGAEDNGGILLEFVGGGHAVICFDYLRPKAEGSDRRHGDDRLRIVGRDGIVEIVDEGTRVVLMTPTDLVEIPPAPPRDLFAEFVASIAGGPPCLVTPEESFRITEVALKARLSAETGKIIEL